MPLQQLRLTFDASGRRCCAPQEKLDHLSGNQPASDNHSVELTDEDEEEEYYDASHTRISDLLLHATSTDEDLLENLTKAGKSWDKYSYGADYWLYMLDHR